MSASESLESVNMTPYMAKVSEFVIKVKDPEIERLFWIVWVSPI